LHKFIFSFSSDFPKSHLIRPQGALLPRSPYGAGGCVCSG